MYAYKTAQVYKESMKRAKKIKTLIVLIIFSEAADLQFHRFTGCHSETSVEIRMLKIETKCNIFYANFQVSMKINIRRNISQLFFVPLAVLYG